MHHMTCWFLEFIELNYPSDGNDIAASMFRTTEDNYNNGWRIVSTLMLIRRPHISVNDNFERGARSFYLGMFEDMDIVIVIVKHLLEFLNKIYPYNIEVLGTALS